ncbi:MAG: cyclic pyranopterin monophosphate synthase MoaC [Acidobacteriota bacterium]
MTETLSHLDSRGQARMVDVGGKRKTRRRAVAEGCVTMGPQAYALARAGDLPKGDLLAAARIAGILAAKAVPSLIPLCHVVALARVSVDFEWEDPRKAVRVVAEASAVDVTGVEMEAMTACAVACLTLYDMVKGVDKGAEVGPIRLLQKSGGKSGTYRR